MIKIILTSLLLLSSLFSVESSIATISSPDKTLELKLSLKDESIFYSLNKNNITIINDSKLGIISDKFNLSDNMSITSIDFDNKDETWSQVWGEQKILLIIIMKFQFHLYQKSIIWFYDLDYLMMG